MEVMSVKAFEPQAFERAIVDVLRLEMDRKNVSRRTLSELSGVSKSRVIRLLSDGGPTAPVTITVLDSFCQALGIRLSTILAEAEELLKDGSYQPMMIPSFDDDDLPEDAEFVLAARRVDPDSPEGREAAALDSLGEESQDI
nr:MAG TPA: Cro/C1-type HTH DNA-binding domain protein [Caudoviricetes sp.]